MDCKDFKAHPVFGFVRCCNCGRPKKEHDEVMQVSNSFDRSLSLVSNPASPGRQESVVVSDSFVSPREATLCDTSNLEVGATASINEPRRSSTTSDKFFDAMSVTSGQSEGGRGSCDTQSSPIASGSEHITSKLQQDLEQALQTIEASELVIEEQTKAIKLLEAQVADRDELLRAALDDVERLKQELMERDKLVHNAAPTVELGVQTEETRAEIDTSIHEHRVSGAETPRPNTNMATVLKALRAHSGEVSVQVLSETLKEKLTPAKIKNALTNLCQNFPKLVQRTGPDQFRAVSCESASAEPQRKNRSSKTSSRRQRSGDEPVEADTDESADATVSRVSGSAAEDASEDKHVMQEIRDTEQESQARFSESTDQGSARTSTTSSVDEHMAMVEESSDEEEAEDEWQPEPKAKPTRASKTPNAKAKGKAMAESTEGGGGGGRSSKGGRAKAVVQDEVENVEPINNVNRGEGGDNRKQGEGTGEGTGEGKGEGKQGGDAPSASAKKKRTRKLFKAPPSELLQDML